MQSFAEEMNCKNFIMGGDWNAELRERDRNDRAQGDRAQKVWEFLETFAIQDAENEDCAAHNNKQWSYINKDKKTKRIDTWHLSANWKDLGPIQKWHIRSDHRPILAEIPKKDGVTIKFGPPKSSPMKAWLPSTPAATSRLARRWASMRVATIAEVQGELAEAARCEIAAMAEDPGAAAGAPAPWISAERRAKTVLTEKICNLQVAEALAKGANNEGERIKCARACWRATRHLRDMAHLSTRGPGVQKRGKERMRA